MSGWKIYILRISIIIISSNVQHYQTSNPESITCDNDGNCYHIWNVLSNWFDANVYCSSMGMVLTSILSEGEFAFIKGILETSNYGVGWIGIQGNSPTWIDGNEISWTNWWTINELGYDDCAMVNNIGMGISSCSNGQPAICKMRLVSSSSSLLITPTTTVDQVSSTTDTVPLVSSSSSLLIPPTTTIDQVSSTTDTVVITVSLSSGSSATPLVPESTATITTQLQLSQSPSLTLQPSQPALSTASPQPSQQHPLSKDLPSLTTGHAASSSSSIIPSSSTVLESTVTMPVKRQQSTRAKLNGRLYFSSEAHVDKRLSASIIRTEWRAIDHVICMHMYCDKEEECESVNFNPETKECELLSAKYTGGNDNFEKAPGWKYYEGMK